MKGIFGFSKRLSLSMAVAAVLALGLVTGVLADNLVGDGDGLTPVTANALNLGDVCETESATGTCLTSH